MKRVIIKSATKLSTIVDRIDKHLNKKGQKIVYDVISPSPNIISVKNKSNGKSCLIDVKYDRETRNITRNKSNWDSNKYYLDGKGIVYDRVTKDQVGVIYILFNGDHDIRDYRNEGDVYVGSKLYTQVDLNGDLSDIKKILE